MLSLLPYSKCVLHTNSGHYDVHRHTHLACALTDLLMAMIIEVHRRCTNFTFKLPGWYLNCSVRFMKNILFEQKKYI